VPRLPVISAIELIACLAHVGYRRTRQKGSHVRLECAGRAPVTVPMHHELDRGTLRAILRTANVSAEELSTLLARA
jgi:predicted RNA binding protein YcfA (HicA-like mRNA interferase family)